MMTRLAHCFLITVLVSLITACGFHLRKSAQIPASMQPIYIASTSPNSLFVQALRRQLDANGIALADSVATAKSTLTITKISNNTLLSSLRGGAEAGQYTVSSSVTFNVVDQHNNMIVPTKTISQQTTYSSNATQALSANYTSSNLSNTLQDQIAVQILNILAALDKHSTTQPVSQPAIVTGP